MQTLPLALLYLPLLAAPFAIPISKLSRKAVGLFSVISVFVPLAVTLTLLPGILRGETYTISFPLTWFTISGVTVNLTQFAIIDGLSWILLFVASFVGGLCVLYSVGYMEHEKKLGYFYFWILLFIGSMLGLVSTDNLLFLVLFWEITTISSFSLISYWYERPAPLKSAFKALTITGIGGLCLIVGSLVLIVEAGTFLISEILNANGHATSVQIALLLITIAALAKSAQVPFYTWLPGAMVAPTPVSALLHAATMVKAGVYLYARFLPLYAEYLVLPSFVLLTSSITILVSSLYAIRSNDAKEVLAFSTISQLGYMFLSLSVAALAWNNYRSIAELAFVGGVLHLLFHSLFKSPLFLTVGAIEHETGTRVFDKLGGLAKVMPSVTAKYLIDKHRNR